MNTQKGFSSLLVLLLFIVLAGGGLFLYTEKVSNEMPEVDTVSTSTQIETEKVKVVATKEVTNTILSDKVFLEISDPQGKILSRGDINGDGYEDAIVQSISCGASCSVSLGIALNNKKGSAQLLDVSFEPGFKPGTAVKSQLTNVSIKNRIISLTGYGLNCGGNSEQDLCTEEKWNILRTIEFKLDSNMDDSGYELIRI